jgi:hypothetical protein
VIIPFVTQYLADRSKNKESESEEYVLQCTKPMSTNFNLHRHIASRDYYSLIYPVTCSFSNNTSKPISISEYGPRLIDNQVSYEMISKLTSYPSITIAEKLSDITGENILLPKLLSAGQQFLFKSIVAIPIGKEVLDHTDKKCKTPSMEILEKSDVTICGSEQKKYLLGNFTNLYRSVGFIGWNRYGSGVKLGNGKEVVHRSDHQLSPVDCKGVGSDTLPICQNNGSYVVPKTYWTNDRGYY